MPLMSVDRRIYEVVEIISEINITIIHSYDIYGSGTTSFPIPSSKHKNELI